MTNTDAVPSAPHVFHSDADRPQAAEGRAQGPGDRGHAGHPSSSEGREERAGLFLIEHIAEGIISQLRPKTALVVGDDVGPLTGELRARGVDARGLEISERGIDAMSSDLRPYCGSGQLGEELDRDYDLITCIEALEHLPERESQVAIANMCRHCEVILFSSSPDAFEEPTNLNVQPGHHWIGLFADQGFFRNLHHDASYVTPRAVLVERRPWTTADTARAYEEAWWQAHRSAEGARAGRDQLRDIVAALEAENEHLASALDTVCADLDSANAERDRLATLLVVERAIFESEVSQAVLAAESARDEVDALRQTKLFRYTSDLRRAYGLVRKALHGLLGRR
ncbi:MAG TPA: class I SAM-dependent methyltransferase [Acidimicrobiales bacterium]|nr:class I SAM-dependent methyltransferase [Acidimicrobiales bacterium]